MGQIRNAIQTKQYSTFNPGVLDQRSRYRIGRQIVRILEQHLGKIRNLKVVDFGCSSGIISSVLADHFGEVLGLDVDRPAIELARESFKKNNLQFKVRSATSTGLAEASVDVVVCNQVYYCIEKPEELIREMDRVLKPGGVVFFGARNKYTLWDAQYYLPLLFILPKRWADWLVRMTGRAKEYRSNYMSLWQLEKLCRRFEIEHDTPRVMHNPRRFGFTNLERFQGVFNLVPEMVWRWVEPLLPNFIWVLVKPAK